MQIENLESQVFIFGTTHQYQWRDPQLSERKHADFNTQINSIVTSYNIQIIAEECSKEALKEKGVSESTLHVISEQHQIDHAYCDPNSNLRSELGIFQENSIRADAFFNNWDEREILRRINKSYRIRENFWLNCILSHDKWPVLFICGSKHTDAFLDIVKNNDLKATVLKYDWESYV